MWFRIEVNEGLYACFCFYDTYKKDYIDLKYDMEYLEKEFNELQEKYDDLKWDYKELVERHKDDEFLIDMLRNNEKKSLFVEIR